jgi:hypothetical protein
MWRNVLNCGVFVQFVGTKLYTRLRVVHGVVIEAAVLGFMKSGRESAEKHQQFEEFDDRTGGRATQNCNADRMKRELRPQPSPEAVTLHQKFVKR